MNLQNKNTLNVPKLRFPKFRGKWEEKKLGNIGKTYNGLTGKTKEDFGTGKPYIQYMQIFDNSRINVNNFGLVSVEEEEKQELAQYGDIFFTTSSETPQEVGYSSVLLNKVDELYLNSFCFGYRINSFNELSPKFARYLFRSEFFRAKIVRLSQGVTRFNLSKLKLMEVNIYLPSLKEQQKIADCLTSLENIITKQSQKLDTLKAHKKGLMQNLFPANGKTTPKLRFSEFKDDWQIVQLGNIGKTYNGLTGKTKEDFGTGKPYIQYMQIFDNSRINVNNFGLVSVEEEEKQELAQYGDIFFTTSSETPQEVGYSSVLLNKVDELYLNSFCFGYRINSFNELSPKFARYLFRSEFFKAKIVRLSQGVTRFNLSKLKLMEVNIYLPSLKEQQKIADCLTSIDEVITANNKKLNTLKAHKKGLLQQLFP